VTTDRLMPGVLKSATTVSGELCVMMALTTQMQKLPALCLDLGEFINLLFRHSQVAEHVTTECHKDSYR